MLTTVNNRHRNDFQEQFIHTFSKTILLDQFVFKLYKAFYQNAVLSFAQIQIPLFLEHGIHPLCYHGTRNERGVQWYEG